MDRVDNTVDNGNVPDDELLFPRTAAERAAKERHEAEMAAAKLLAVHPTAVPDVMARDWLTREEAAKALDKSERTVDRLIKVKKLVRIGEGVPVKISKASVERVVGADALITRRQATIIVEQASYDALLLHKERLEQQLRERDTKLLAWEGSLAELEAAKAELAEQLEAERQERERIAAELAAEKARGFFKLPRWLGGGR